jgi:hypothetical protein
MMDSLKPCPLCSGRARLVTFKKRIGRVCPHTVFRQHIQCTKCGLQSKQSKSKDAAERMIKRWNTRPDATALVEALQGLLEATERHVFGDECLAEREAARATLQQWKDKANG